MQEIWKVRSFSHWFFHDFFMNFFHFEKNSGFSISCTSHRRGDMYRNFTPSDPIFPLWARAPTARAVPVELCMFFITFSTVFLLILLGTWVRFAWTWKNILICQVFFDRGCLWKPCVALTHTMKIWNFENLQNVNFGGSKIGPDALIRDPSPARAGTSRGGGCQFFATGGGALVRVQVDYGCRDMFARAPSHMWSRFMCFSSKKQWKRNLARGYPPPRSKKTWQAHFHCQPPAPPIKF